MKGPGTGRTTEGYKSTSQIELHGVGSHEVASSATGNPSLPFMNPMVCIIGQNYAMTDQLTDVDERTTVGLATMSPARSLAATAAKLIVSIREEIAPETSGVVLVLGDAMATIVPAVRAFHAAGPAGHVKPSPRSFSPQRRLARWYLGRCKEARTSEKRQSAEFAGLAQVKSGVPMERSRRVASTVSQSLTVVNRTPDRL